MPKQIDQPWQLLNETSGRVSLCVRCNTRWCGTGDLCPSCWQYRTVQ